jgi:aryl-alcohol dehydrogenase-like predicted oxidoreductase
VTSVIIGAKTKEHVVDNVAATELKLSAAELATLTQLSTLPPEYPGWMLEFQGKDRREALKSL